ncbi:MAG: leucine-rich repeat protein, partial [Muribaculaceae bacterium]|nr:leucine-rich repeat protein [Muribaculaceae bacterium]
MNRLANICLRSLLFLIITIIPVDAFSEKFTIDCVTYRTIDDKCAEVYSAAGVDSINIHGEVNGYTVTHIRERVFFDHHNTYHISIPNTITHIGNAAFWHCKYLQELVIPPSVRHIGNYAFNGLHLIKSATIPKSVTSIGHAIFHPCFVLTELNVEEGNPVYDSRENCNGIIETATNTIIASCLTTKIPNSVKHIGKSCFSSAEFSSIEIPESIETIKACAFSSSKIEKINLPNSITEIGDSAFMLCSSLLGPLNIPKRVKNIGKNTFLGCIYISSVTFPDSLETIGDEAFNNCTFGDIKLPSTVKHIGNYAFNHFSKKKVTARITIPDSTKTIGTDIINENHIGVIYNAENCTVTKTVFRPKKSILFGRKVKNVPYNLLKHNYNIPIIISQNTIPPQIDDDFFNDSIKSFATLYVPKGYIETYRKATGWQKIQNIEENPGEFTSLTLNKSHLELPELQ